MKIAVSTAFSYVVEGMDAIPLENAKLVLAQELTRLDALLHAHIHNAGAGDIEAGRVVLNIMHHRAPLLGFYPEQGKTQVLIAAAAAADQPSPIKIEFIMPTKRDDDSGLDSGHNGLDGHHSQASTLLKTLAP
jgi:hypothetical protein